MVEGQKNPSRLGDNVVKKYIYLSLAFYVWPRVLKLKSPSDLKQLSTFSQISFTFI